MVKSFHCLVVLSKTERIDKEPPLAEVLNGDRAVETEGDVDNLSEPLARFVDAVGKDLKRRVLAALQTVRAEDDRRPLANAVGAFQLTDDALIVNGFFGHDLCILSKQFFNPYGR